MTFHIEKVKGEPQEPSLFTTVTQEGEMFPVVWHQCTVAIPVCLASGPNDLFLISIWILHRLKWLYLENGIVWFLPN